MVRFKKELHEIDSRHKNKTFAKLEMEEFLASKDLNKEARLGIILDFVINKDDIPDEASLLINKLADKYRDIADIRIRLCSPFKSDIAKLNKLIEQADRAIDEDMLLLPLIESLNNEH